MLFGTHATCLRSLLADSLELDWVLVIFSSTRSISCYTLLEEVSSKLEFGNTMKASPGNCFSCPTSMALHPKKDLACSQSSVST